MALATLLVSGRLLVSTVRAVREGAYRAALALGAGALGLFALLFVALFLWFVLAVSHQQKDVGDTYGLMALTGIPYFLASFGLWRLPARLGVGRRPGGGAPA
jgi:hypothetical protein